MPHYKNFERREKKDGKKRRQERINRKLRHKLQQITRKNT